MEIILSLLLTFSGLDAQAEVEKIELYSLSRTLFTRVALNAETIKEHPKTKSLTLRGKRAEKVISELNKGTEFDQNCEVNTRILGIIYYSNSQIESFEIDQTGIAVYKNKCTKENKKLLKLIE